MWGSGPMPRALLHLALKSTAWVFLFGCCVFVYCLIEGFRIMFDQTSTIPTNVSKILRLYVDQNSSPRFLTLSVHLQGLNDLIREVWEWEP